MSDQVADDPQVPREDGGQRRRRNAADPEQVARAASKAGRERAQSLADWKWLAKHPEGLRIIRELLHPLGQSPYTPHANDTARLCGQLEFAIEIRRKLWDACPEALALMLAADIEAVRKERAQVAEDTEA